MGKAGSSCLKIITCGGRSADNDDKEDLGVAEGRTSTDKRRWSFGKKSAKHRSISDTIITEPLSVPINSKGIPETRNSHFHAPKNVEVPQKIPAEVPQKIPVEASEKVSVIKFEEEAAPMPSSNVKVDIIEPFPITSDIIHSDASLHESSVIVIQAAMRRYLARKELRIHKNVVKLQAVVRGHLVRREAVGTLRCVQAILKMQTLVRARRLRQSAEKLDGKETLDSNLPEDLVRSNFLDKENSAAKPDKICSSSKKIMANKFARQILETTSSKKPIHISCEPLKSDSAWKWLERWMAIATSDIGHQQELITSEFVTLDIGNMQELIMNTEISKQGGEVVESANSEVQLEITQMIASFTVDSEPDPNETEMPMSNIESQASCNSESNNEQEKPCIQSEAKVVETGALMKNDIKLEALDINPQQTAVVSSPPVHPDSPSDKHVVDLEKSKRTKRMTVETLETEGKKFGFNLRKSSSPAFAAVQSKFEELSAPSNIDRSVSSYQENMAEPKLDSPTTLVSADAKLDNIHQTASEQTYKSPAPEVSAGLDADNAITKISAEPMSDCLRTELMVELKLNCLTPEVIAEIKSGNDKGNSDTAVAENSFSDDFRVQTATSECGTEISISSTLDSPDRSEADGGEIILELESFGARSYVANGTANNSRDDENSDSEPNKSYTCENVYEQHEVEESKANSGDFAPVIASFETENLSTKERAPGTPVLLDSATNNQNYILSRVESPTSHITAADSQGTPSSHISSNAKKNKVSRNLTARLLKSEATSKKSPSNGNNDSGAKSSTEHLPKDPKNGKRKNSLGTKLDQIDREPRVTSIPSYMQATESAKAKVHPSVSPKASPDVHEKERKRHSLPMGNGKHDSPRMQRSASQVQQGSKGIGTNSPQNSAEKRWQR